MHKLIGSLLSTYDRGAKTGTAIAAFLVIACSCATTGSTPPVSWPDVVQCVAPADGLLLDRVVAILLAEGGDAQVIGEGAVHQLDQLAADKGTAAVICMVDLAINRLTPASASVQALTSDGAPLPTGEPALVEHAAGKELASLAAAQRGRDFLRRAGTTIETEE